MILRCGTTFSSIILFDFRPILTLNFLSTSCKIHAFLRYAWQPFSYFADPKPWNQRGMSLKVWSPNPTDPEKQNPNQSRCQPILNFILKILEIPKTRGGHPWNVDSLNSNLTWTRPDPDFCSLTTSLHNLKILEKSHYLEFLNVYIFAATVWRWKDGCEVKIKWRIKQEIICDFQNFNGLISNIHNFKFKVN